LDPVSDITRPDEVDEPKRKGMEMDLYEFAMAIEKEGADYYRKLAGEAIDQEVGSIFHFLAREEESHYEILNAWYRETDVPPLTDMNILKESHAVFKRLSNHFETYGVPATHYYNAYEKALKFEEKSVALYESILTKLDKKDQKGIVNKILDQEKSHVQFLQNMLEFLRHPGEWLENAEWFHQEAY
jgi:rubrerythrin